MGGVRFVLCALLLGSISSCGSEEPAALTLDGRWRLTTRVDGNGRQFRDEKRVIHYTFDLQKETCRLEAREAGADAAARKTEIACRRLRTGNILLGGPEFGGAVEWIYEIDGTKLRLRRAASLVERKETDRQPYEEMVFERDDP